MEVLKMKVAYLGILLFLWGVSFTSASEQVMLQMLHEVINTTIFVNSPFKPISTFPYKITLDSRDTRDNFQYSDVQNVCHNVKRDTDRIRVGCCTPSDVRHIYNAMITQDGKMIIFQNPDSAASSRNNKLHLPPVSSVKQQAKINFNIPTEYRSEKLDISKCTRYFNGTLHVVGRSTVKNVYHALADNVLPLISQILLDAYLSPHMLYEPRMLLTGFQGTGSSDREEGAVHMRLLRDLMPYGHLPYLKAGGTCFRRVVWGHGPHMFYTDSLQVLRKFVAKFARNWAQKLVFHGQEVKGMKFYDNFESRNVVLNRKLQEENEGLKYHSRNKQLHQRGKAVSNKHKRSISSPGVDKIPSISPSPTASEVNISVVQQNWWKIPLPKSVNGQPLKILVYTRGNSGFGRTIENEDILVQALRERGALAFICCDFTHVSLEQQLYNALNADIIIGLHGAAITHGVFMKPGSISLELKTLYAYESNLFGLIAESRNGIHGQVDIKKYFRPGGQRPIDALLITRIMKVLDESLSMQKKLGLEDPRTVEATMFSRGDFVNGDEISDLHPSSHDLCQISNILTVISASPGDFVFGPPCVPGLLNHILGPPQHNHSQICSKLLYAKIRDLLGVKGESFHCHICTTFVG